MHSRKLVGAMSAAAALCLAGAACGPAGDGALNSPPVARIMVHDEPAIGEEIWMDGLDSFDPDTDPITYRWSLVQSPGGSEAIIEHADASVACITPDLSGMYVIELVVRDQVLSSEPVSTELEVP